jgi:hypothetical protein
MEEARAKELFFEPGRRELILRSIRTATRHATRILLYFTSVPAPHFNQLEFRISNSEKHELAVDYFLLY